MQRQKYTVEVVNHDLDLDEHLPLLEKGWIIQRAGWVVIIGIMIAGASGLFGSGPLSSKNAISGNFKAAYEQFYRYETEMTVLVESQMHINSISFPQQYLKDFRIVRFVPEPANNTTTINEVTYNFLPGQNHIVSVYLIPRNFGGTGGTMKINGSNSIYLHHFIYP